MGAGAPAFDSSDNMFFSTGNGAFDDTSSSKSPLAPNNDFGESFLNLIRRRLVLQDFLYPVAKRRLDRERQRHLGRRHHRAARRRGFVGSPQRNGGVDKQGHAWMIDRNNMSGFQPNADNTVQYLSLHPVGQLRPVVHLLIAGLLERYGLRRNQFRPRDGVSALQRLIPASGQPQPPPPRARDLPPPVSDTGNLGLASVAPSSGRSTTMRTAPTTTPGRSALRSCEPTTRPTLAGRCTQAPRCRRTPVETPSNSPCRWSPTAMSTSAALRLTVYGLAP